MISEFDINDNFDRFIKLIEDNVTRDGVTNLIAWLKAKDTKIAPASTKYHLSCKGGLVKHCLNVYDRLKRLLDMEYPKFVPDLNGEMMESKRTCPYSEETIVLVSLLHDMSKIEFYEVQERNVKVENGNWIKVPYYSVRDEESRLIFSDHATNSDYMVSKFIKLKYEEELAIIHHEGGFDSATDKNSVAITMQSYKKH